MRLQLVQRGQHICLAVAIVARLDDPLGRVEADDEHRAGVDASLLVEGRRVGGVGRVAPGELAQPVEHGRRREGGLVDVDGRQLERHRPPQQRRCRRGQRRVPGVQRVEGSREQRRRRFGGQRPVGQDAKERDGVVVELPGQRRELDGLNR